MSWAKCPQLLPHLQGNVGDRLTLYTGHEFWSLDVWGPVFVDAICRRSGRSLRRGPGVPAHPMHGLMGTPQGLGTVLDVPSLDLSRRCELFLCISRPVLCSAPENH